MNNKGWGLASTLVLCSIIGFALIISAVIYDRAFNGNLLKTPNTSNDTTIVTKSYKEMENKVEIAATQYADKYYPNLHEGDIIYVSVKQLQIEKLLDTLVDTHNNTCSGYASFTNKSGGIQYKPYIKCGKVYMTKDYDKSFDK